MCGITAIHAYHPSAAPADRAELRRIRDHMAARGPDGCGEWFSDDGRVAMGHRRLAIIDPRPDADQPMRSTDGALTIVFNGEIYNYRALRSELERSGTIFRTRSDTEVLLELYRRDGAAMFGRLRGMYAFALWDARRSSLLLARDPYGIKPLYYADDGRSVRVASQVKALLAGGVLSREADPAGHVGFLLFGSVPEPFTCWSAIRAMPAGTWLSFDAEGTRHEGRHFNLAQVYRDAHDSMDRIDDSAGVAQDALRDSIRAHLIADVPVGAFLSAGVDSGGIVGMMRDCSEAPLRTTTIRFDEYAGSSDDEAPIAESIARRYGADHVTRLVGESEFRADLPRILAAMDQPSVDGINTWFAAKACSERGLKVALSGVGGDELFGSYPSFRSLPRWVRAMALPARLPLLGRSLRALSAPLLARQGRVSPKLAGIAELGGTWEGAYLLRRGLFMPWELQGLVPADVLGEGLRRLDWRSLVRATIEPDPGSAFARVACMESGLYLSNQQLRDTDWASMAHSLEVRTPLVDAELTRVLARATAHAGAGDGKGWLARAPSLPLPQDVLQRPKTGFQTPVGKWLAPTGARAGDPHATGAARGHWSRRVALDVIRGPGLAA